MSTLKPMQKRNTSCTQFVITLELRLLSDTSWQVVKLETSGICLMITLFTWLIAVKSNSHYRVELSILTFCSIRKGLNKSIWKSMSYSVCCFVFWSVFIRNFVWTYVFLVGFLCTINWYSIQDLKFLEYM